MHPNQQQTPPGEPTPLVRAKWLRNIRGFSVIPLDSPLDPVAERPEQVGKVPVETWAQYQQTPADDATIVRWFGNGRRRNVGIVTGAVSQVVVVDLDSAEALTWAADHLPATPMMTATSKGQHWFYRHPGTPVSNKARIRTTDGRLQIDVRGDGGYVVGPGSLHASGVRYEALGSWGASLDTLPVFDQTWIAPPPVTPALTIVSKLAISDSRVRRAEAYLEATPPAIAGQGGDEHTFQVVCRVARGFDLSDSDAMSLLRAWNARCVPPWTEQELSAKLAGARKYGTEPIGARLNDPQHVRQDIQVKTHPDLRSRSQVAESGNLDSTGPVDRSLRPDDHARAFPLTDSGNAEYFAHRHGDDVRYDHRRQRWLVWSGHRWQPDADAAVRRLAKDAIRQRLKDAAGIEDSEARSRAAKWALASESRGRLDAMLYLAQAEKPIADAGVQWDADPMLLGVPNGVVDLRSGALRGGRREDRITMNAAAAFDPDATCPRWERFVCEVFANKLEMVEYIHRAIGYSLTGNVEEQAAFMPYGTGANGKGTLFNTVADIIGDYAYSMPFSTIEMQQRAAIPNDIAALDGKRFVTASETNDGVRLNEARLKALTGCDPITARFLHAEFFTFRPVAKFWLSVNHKPIVRDDSYGFWRRIRLIPFTQLFTVNPRLSEELRSEAAGILAWAVRGCIAWQQHGLIPPTTVLEATATYESDSDPVSAFLDEGTIRDQQAEVRASELYAHYRRWADTHNLTERERMTATMFGRKMQERLTRVKTRDGWLYQGVSTVSVVTGLAS